MRLSSHPEDINILKSLNFDIIWEGIVLNSMYNVISDALLEVNLLLRMTIGIITSKEQNISSIIILILPLRWTIDEKGSLRGRCKYLFACFRDEIIMLHYCAIIASAQ